MSDRPDHPKAGPDDPLRLDVAAKLVFPYGGMTASGLRKERDAGRLVVERIAGKDFTTLRAIANMRALCRVERNRPVSGSGKGPTPKVRGSSSTADAKSARMHLKQIARKLKQRSPNTSEADTGRTSATVIPLASR